MKKEMNIMEYLFLGLLALFALLVAWRAGIFGNRAPKGEVAIEGDGNYAFKVSESHKYQKELALIVDGREPDSEYLKLSALIEKEPHHPRADNPFRITINGYKVGEFNDRAAALFLERIEALELPISTQFRVGALIISGVQNGDEAADYAVRLDLPAQLSSIEVSDLLPDPDEQFVETGSQRAGALQRN